MKPEDIPFLFRKATEQVEKRVGDAFGTKSTESESEAVNARRFRDDEGGFEPDWDDLDKKANIIVGKYAVVSAAWNVLPPPLDVMGVTATFSKMTSDLAGVYQVMVTAKRARQMGWAIASTTASVLGVAYAGSRLMKFIPGGGWLASLLVQAPIVGVVAWAAGDALKWYFREAKRGTEPSIASLRDAFAKTLHIKIKNVKPDIKDGVSSTITVSGATVAPDAAPEESSGEKIATLFELKRIGAISEEEYKVAKADLLKRL